MAAAAAAVAISQQAVVDAFMRADAVRPSEAIMFVPNGYIQRSLFESYRKSGIFKPEGARWFLDIPAYTAAKKKQKTRAAYAALGLVVVTAALAAIL